ncbi:MAG: hypothetical protein HGA97_10620 [Chlorobiaceae bacterium]|nr:hypothetical protein [Chlorobiaceae bacterium]
MSWHPYHVVFQLCSPLHIGAGEVGNVQRTYPYVTGRVFWGALTMRLTRNAIYSGMGTTDSDPYVATGKKVHDEIAYTYFYPAIESGEDYKVIWPWPQYDYTNTKDIHQVDKEDCLASTADSKRLLIRSYASTAIDSASQAAAEALLHESEFIAPFTIERESRQVYLSGYVFIKDGCSFEWEKALENVQFGGDRCYGWGRVFLKDHKKCEPSLFGGIASFDGSGERPRIALTKSTPYLLAHTKAENTSANGDIEPLVGRLWQLGAGQSVEFSGICFRPGSTIAIENASFTIGPYGVWSPCNTATNKTT